MSKDDHVNGLACLKYMLLSKIMNGQGEEVHAIINAKNSLRFVDDEMIGCLKEVADAYKISSLCKCCFCFRYKLLYSGLWFKEKCLYLEVNTHIFNYAIIVVYDSDTLTILCVQINLMNTL